MRDERVLLRGHLSADRAVAWFAIVVPAVSCRFDSGSDVQASDAGIDVFATTGQLVSSVHGAVHL